MLRLHKLYTKPAQIEPIVFTAGLNLIVGEPDETSEKTNGVGKSLCIEFIDFALMKRASVSRVSKIPAHVFPAETQICLDFSIDGINYTALRSMAQENEPTIETDGRSKQFDSLTDAVQFLSEKLFARSSANHPSFRAVLAPLIRDERSEFKSLIRCFDTELRIPPNYAPHLYILGINVDLYEEVKTLIRQIDDLKSAFRQIKKDIVRVTEHDNIKDARASLNELDGQLATITHDIEELESVASYEGVRAELETLQKRIDADRRAQTLRKRELSKLDRTSAEVDVDVVQVREFYDRIKAGMGHLIARDLEQVLAFKAKIDTFQRHLLAERSTKLKSELKDLEEQLSLLDGKHKQLLQILDQEGQLRSVRQTYAAHQAKASAVATLRAFLDKSEELKLTLAKRKNEKSDSLLQFELEVRRQEEKVRAFEETILEIHQFIQGNRKASFELKPTPKKQVVEIDMRIDDDGR